MKKSYPTDDVVSHGGWLALESEASQALAERNFKKLKPYLQTDTFDVVKAGGWSAVQSLSADPKGALLKLAEQSLRGSSGDDDSGVNSDHLEAIVALLQAQGKGFDSDVIDGDWQLVLKGKGKPKTKRRLRFLNRLLKREKLRSTSDFDVSRREFYGTAPILKWGRLSSTVAYSPTSENFEKIGNSIVLRRIACDIQSVSWKFWKLPKLKFPLQSSGYLDFVYLDKDLRVTRGNRGGLFVHMRPSAVDAIV